MKTTKHIIQILLIAFLNFACTQQKKEEINIGFIAPLSLRATDLGIDPVKAMELAVEQYNNKKLPEEPSANLYIRDDQWERERALPLYNELKQQHNIDIIFISNTDGTVEIQDKILQDNVICINPLNSDDLLSSLNRNTFKIAKKTEEANGLVAIRIIELGLKKVAVLHYPNDFMARAANTVKSMLDEENIFCKILPIEKGQTDYTDLLKKYKNEGFDAYAFFGYREFGYAMKQARDLGIKAHFFGSTTLLDPTFYDNSEGDIVGTEFPFFTASDGNYVLAYEFLEAFKNKHGEMPFSVWPAMQAYDAINLVLNEAKKINDESPEDGSFGDWLRKDLHRVRYFQGVCGNLAITEDGSSRGIYFSLYKYKEKGVVTKVRR